MIGRCATLLLLGSVCCGADLPTWYVSTRGNDAWSGTLEKPNEAGTDGPLASPRAARDASRSQSGTPRRIVLAEGSFFLAETLELDLRDNRLTIEGAGPGRTVLYAGRQLTGWQPAGGELRSAPLPADPPGWDFRVLLVGGRMQDRARVPEEGYLEHETRFGVRWMSTAGGGWERKPTTAELTTLRYRAGDIPADLRVENAEVTVCHMWDESTVGVAGHDPATRTLVFSSPCGHPPGAFGVLRYTIGNTREGMTRPGQWYLDRVERRVVHWPRPGDDPGAAVTVAPAMTTAVRVTEREGTHAADVVLKSLTVSGTDAPLKPAGFGASNWPGAIELHGADRVRLEDLEVAHCGAWGIREWGGRELTVCRGRLHHLGAGGVRFGSGALIEENHIHDIGLVSASAIGIMGGGTRSVVRRNVVHDTPYSGMCVSGTETRIEENLLYRCMLVHHDGAAIYMGGGNRCVIRRNLARDMAEVGKGYGVSAYYLDEKCRGCVVSENVSINIPHPSQNHMTLDCELRDNVFIHDGDMKLAFSRCSGHRVTGNTFHLAGTLNVVEADAVAEWTGNRIVTRTEKGGDIREELPRQPFVPRDKPRYLKVTPIAPPPTIDGKLGGDEWPGSGTALAERPDQRSVRGAPTSVKIHADAEMLYIATNIVTMFPDQRRLGTAWGTDEGVELVLEARRGDTPVVQVLRGFTDGAFQALTLGGASPEQAAAFAGSVLYGASVDKQIWRSEWAVPLAELGVAPGQKAVVPFNLTAYRSEDNVLAQFAGTRGETWDLRLGGRLMLHWDEAAASRPTLTATAVDAPPAGAGDWPGAAADLAQTPGGEPLSGEPCRARVLRCGDDLYVRVSVPVKAAAAITRGNAWRTDDGAEVCVRGKAPDGTPATWVVHGFAGGAWELSDEAGVPT
ncbi:MAG: right-handed parallel beta-helix repeat-containing protein, partial [Lentisphaeria bacterium]|nr:right-handed parallel beta-helix repeat-containing protein [Lentisphaeria bacterium]